MFGDNADFFPTPRAVARKMLAKVSKDARYYLEPSAGKGDIVDAIKANAVGHQWGAHNVKVDCIESDPDLVATLAGKELNVVGHDFLTYPGVCFYDVILMNPPFSEGARHLLRAWDFMHDGEIVCLLNQETIDNPCTAERQRLAAIISEHGGEVEALGDCFKDSQRSTGVHVAMVYLRKKSADDLPDLWKTDKPERAHDDTVDDDAAAMLAIRDELGNMEHYYNEATTHMLKAFAHLRKASVYMGANGVSVGEAFEKVAGLALKNTNSARGEFYQQHRRAAWMKVFEKMQFRKWLDKKQTDEFLRDVQTNSNIPFTADNIKGTLENVMLQRGRLFEQSVVNVFDELTKYHKENTGHTEGWKSNSDFMVNRKLVFPWGCEFCNIFKSFKLRYGNSCIDIYNDLDRLLCVLEGKDFGQCHTIEQALRATFDGRSRCTTPGTCESEYFEIRFFKKGTIHLRWKNRDLWEQFNFKAAAGKKWVGRPAGEWRPSTWDPKPRASASPRRSNTTAAHTEPLFDDAIMTERIAKIKAGLASYV